MNNSTPTEVDIDTRNAHSTSRPPNKREHHLFDAVQAMNRRFGGTEHIKRDRINLPGGKERLEAAQEKRARRAQKRSDARLRQLETDPVVGRRNGAALARRLSENTDESPRRSRVPAKPRVLEASYGEQLAHLYPNDTTV